MSLGLARSSLAALLGLLAWPGQVGSLSLLPLATLYPALWVASTSRWQSAAVVGAYHLAASRGLVRGAALYFGQDPALGVGLWLSAAALMAGAYGALWHPRRQQRLRRLPLALLLVAVPPLGIVGWASPWPAAGVLFPGWGWGGLLALLALIMALAAWPRAALAPFVILSVAAALVAPGLPDAGGWHGLDTAFAVDTTRRDFHADYQRQHTLMGLVRTSTAPVVVLPESAAGRWNADTQALWRPLQTQLEGRVVLLGGEQVLPGGQRANVLIRLDTRGAQVVYRQRLPVPLAMWRPWDRLAFGAFWSETPVFTVGKQRVAALICYEQVLVWPVLHAMMYRPTVLVGMGNVGWVRHTSLPAIQQVTLSAWARLLGTPLVTAFNRGQETT